VEEKMPLISIQASHFIVIQMPQNGSTGFKRLNGYQEKKLKIAFDFKLIKTSERIFVITKNCDTKQLDKRHTHRIKLSKTTKYKLSSKSRESLSKSSTTSKGHLCG